MSTIEQHLGDKAELLLSFSNAKISKDRLHLPGPDFVDRVISLSDRNNRVLVNLQRIYQHGRLGGSGYVSILPVDQGIEHSAGAMRWLPLSECWELSRVSTLIEFRSSLKSITMSCSLIRTSSIKFSSEPSK